MNDIYKLVPKKYKKLIANGRWEWITKHHPTSGLLVVGVRRKSTGQERFF